MWPFGFGNKYPYTDFHELNADWILNKITLFSEKIREMYKNWDEWKVSTEPTISETVNQWLDDHPEATTTVQDGSITEAKLNADFLLQVDNDFVILPLFGGVCDGLADDSAAFNAALAQAAADGKKVLIRSIDTVRIDQSVFLPTNTHLIINGTVVCNYGPTACFETFDRTTATPVYTGTHDIVIEGTGTINGGGDISTLYAVTPIRIHHSKDVTIKDITITNWVNNHAIETSSDNVLIDNVSFLGCVQTSFDGNHSEAVQIDICTSGSASGAIPYDGTMARNTTIKNCTFGPSDAGNLYTAIGNHGEVVDDSFGTMYTGIRILNNVIRYARDNAINLLMNAEDIEIYGNRFENQIFAGATLNDGNILLSYYIQDAKIHNNVFIDSYGTGINLGYIGDTGAGTYANDWMNNIDISGNQFINYCTRNTNNSGIILAHKCKAVSICNNTFNTDTAINAIPVRVQDATNNQQYLINSVIDCNYYNGKIISYGSWSSELAVDDTFQIPNIMMNASRIHIFGYRYAIGGNIVVTVSDIKNGYLADGTSIYIDPEHYFKLKISTTGLITLSEKGASSGNPYLKVEVID